MDNYFRITKSRLRMSTALKSSAVHWFDQHWNVWHKRSNMKRLANHAARIYFVKRAIEEKQANAGA